MKTYQKFLVLIPVLAAVVALTLYGYIKLSEDGGEDDSETSGQNQAIQLEIDDMQMRIEQYQSLVEMDPNDIVALGSMGDAYLEMGILQSEAGDVNGSYKSFKNAADSYNKYLAINPEDVEARIDLGYSYHNLLMFEISERELKTAVEMAPDNQRAWHVYGVVLEKLEKTDMAKEAWQTSYNLDPNSSIGQESKSFLDQFGGAEVITVPSAP